jgi:hypothetical protein
MPDIPSPPPAPAPAWNVGDKVSSTLNPAFFTTGVVSKVTDTTVEIQWDNFALSVFQLSDLALQSVTNITTGSPPGS